MNLARPKLGNQSKKLTRQLDSRSMKNVKEVRMSRLKTGYTTECAGLTIPRNAWMRFTLSWPTSALALLAAAGCTTAGGSNLLNSTYKKPIVAATETAPADMSLRGSTSALQSNQRPALGRSDVVTVSHSEPVAAPVSAYAAEPMTIPSATTASYQVAGQCSPSCGTNCGCGASSHGGEPYYSPIQGQQVTDVQEYIFDGGDLDPALLVRKDATVAGLNPTDTVAYYETYDGRLCITPTNRVPIYAPRFGAVRQITGAVLSEHALATERILAPISPSRFEDKNLVSSMVQPIAAQGEDKVSLIDAFRDRNSGVPLAQMIPPQRMSDAIVPFEAVDFFRTGVLKHEDIAVLGQFFQNAKAWETPESLEVLVDGVEAAIVRDTKQPQDVHVYDLPPGKCSLRICKAASHMIANSGDQITFTIRFDNVGAQPIEKVVILDSLSPRLEYIQDSQQSSISPAPEFSAEPNDVGSTVLKWQFKSSLKTGEGGVLHFRCLVR